MPDADPRSLLDAAFAELDAAVEALTKLTETAAGQSAATATPDPLSAERALLRAVFQHAPVPLFVLEQDATVRRANARAGDLIGAPPGYATGKTLTAFVDLPFRAAVLHVRAEAWTDSNDAARAITDKVNVFLAMFHNAEASVASPGSDADVKALFDSLQVRQESNRAVLIATLPTEMFHKLAQAQSQMPAMTAPAQIQQPAKEKKR